MEEPWEVECLGTFTFGLTRGFPLAVAVRGTGRGRSRGRGSLDEEKGASPAYFFLLQIDISSLYWLTDPAYFLTFYPFAVSFFPLAEKRRRASGSSILGSNNIAASSLDRILILHPQHGPISCLAILFSHAMLFPWLRRSAEFPKRYSNLG